MLEKIREFIIVIVIVIVTVGTRVCIIVRLGLIVVKVHALVFIHLVCCILVLGRKC